MAVEPGTAAELIRGLIAGRGLTQRAVARELGVSDRMVRKVLTGASEGANFVPRLSSLVRTGRSGGVPVALRPARIRAPRGAGVKSIPRPVPQAPPRAARGRFGATEREFLPGGGSVQTITAPKSEGPGREQARVAIMDAVRDTGRDAHIMFVLRDAAGNTATLGSKGGYRSSTALRGMVAEGNDPFKWFESELEGVQAYAPLGTIVAVTVVML